ncbi:MAG TPA: Stk1 family PASTA domain-containing Ser/Thr kinase [Candidatus Limnocylindrales bacterium]|nr:Stk1 family PASTA domain-containing Ser/Thr kinase [Candidatus Limnocylindrales bacterium]
MNPTNPSAERIFNNRYRVDGTLGNGGMANVYVGTDTLLRRRVAIKVLREQYASDDDFVKRFSYEAQAAAKLSHPNIVNVFDFGREDHSYYIVMELVDGATLGDIMRDERVLPEPVAVDYAIQIASGLAYAHRQGLLHRDVKPANILVTKDDVVKLSDFGIARAVSEHTLGVTQPGMVMGSVAYISPEQAQGHELDERSDLYSVGVVLYQMLTGSLPFVGETPVAVALKHVSEPPPPIDPRTTGVSPAIASIVARLLRKNPQERFASATELASALREAREKPHAALAGPAFAEAPTSSISAVKPPVPPPRRSTAPDQPRTSTLPVRDDAIDVEYVAQGPDRRWILFPALLALAILIGYFALRGTMGGGGETSVAVPDLHGMSTTRAQQELAQRGLQSKPVGESSDTVPRDRVIRQDPAPGSKLARNAVVTLFFSQGLPRVAVPDVKGYSVADATRTLQNAKLKAKVVEKFDPSVPAQQVIDVSPPVSAQVAQNSVVTLTVSKGVQPIVVPDVVNMPVDKARAKLAALGLRLNVEQQTPSDTIPANVIASQDPQPQSTAQPNASVNVIVSTGAQSTVVPNVVGQDPDAAQAAIANAGFTPSLAYAVDAANPTGKIASQDPPAGTKAKKGANVSIRLSVSGSVPDVTGMTLDEAKRALTGSGYQIGNVAYTADSSLEDGKVVRTEPEANSVLKPGESVNLTIMRSGGQ